MSSKKAVEYFLGTGGAGRLNCAQAVAGVFKDKGLFSEEEFRLLAACGNGRAPGGYCGSVYAALAALGKKDPEKARQFEEMFERLAGSLECRKIREAGKIKCRECVAVSADFVGAACGEKK